MDAYAQITPEILKFIERSALQSMEQWRYTLFQQETSMVSGAGDSYQSTPTNKRSKLKMSYLMYL